MTESNYSHKNIKDYSLQKYIVWCCQKVVYVDITININSNWQRLSQVVLNLSIMYVTVYLLKICTVLFTEMTYNKFETFRYILHKTIDNLKVLGCVENNFWFSINIRVGQQIRWVYMLLQNKYIILHYFLFNQLSNVYLRFIYSKFNNIIVNFRIW